MSGQGAEVANKGIFGDMVLASGFATQGHLDECILLQSAEIASGQPARPLGEIMVEQGYLTQLQVDQILSKQKKRSEKRFGPYKLLKKLGEGGMGTVFKARIVSSGLDVALKVMSKKLSSNKMIVSRFKREAKLGLKLEHPNIVKGIDAGQIGEICFIAMELVEGGSLRELLKERGGILDEEEALEITRDIAEALGYAHRHKIVHRDVKPENIMFDKEGNAKLADFGLVKLNDTGDAGLTQSGVAIGTPHYISPEQAKGESTIDIRADIYSLGATLYRMVTGRTPFKGKSPFVVMSKHVSEEPKPPEKLNPDLSDNCVALIDRMMAKKPKDRHTTPAELITDINWALGDDEDQEEVTSRKVVAHAPQQDRTQKGGSQASVRPAQRRRTTGPRKAIEPARGDRSVASRIPVPAGRTRDGMRPGRPAQKSSWASLILLACASLGAVLAIGFALKGDRKRDRRAAHRKRPRVASRNDRPPVTARPITPAKVAPKATKPTSRPSTTRVSRPTPSPSTRPTPRSLDRSNSTTSPAKKPQLGPGESEALLSKLAPERKENLIANYTMLGRPTPWIRNKVNSDNCVYMHANVEPTPATITWLLPKPASRFEASFYAAHRSALNVWFSIWCDGKQRWRSSTIQGEEGPTLCSVELTGVKRLTLKTHCLGSTQNNHTVWVDPKVIFSSGAKKAAGKASARAAFLKYLKEFETAIKKDDVPAAIQSARDARGDPELKAVASKTKGLADIADVMQVAEDKKKKALETMQDGRPRMLRTRRGKLSGVIKEVTDDALRVKVTGRINNKTIEYEKVVKVADLTQSCRARLFGLSKPTKPDEWMEVAIRKMLVGDVDAAEKALGSATGHALAKHYRARIDEIRRRRREQAATAAWKQIQKQVETRKWKEAKASLQAFGTKFDGTSVAKEKAQEALTHLDTAEREIARVEGYFFDFKTPENYARFEKLMPVVKSSLTETTHADGKVIFRALPNDTGSKWARSAVQLRSKHLVLGHSFDLEYRAYLDVTSANVTEEGRRRGYCNICFLEPEAPARAGAHYYHRYHLEIHTGYNGFLTYGLRGAGQYGNYNGGPAGLFEGLTKVGRMRGGYLQGGKPKPPASADGWYHTRISKRGRQVVIAINGTEVVNTELPEEASAYIAASPLTINAGSLSDTKEVYLGELFYRACQANSPVKARP